MEAFNKSFKYWKTQEVEEVFGIKQDKKNSLLLEWLNVSKEVTDKEKERLIELQEHLIEKVDYWNEAAIKFYFLGPLMAMVDYDEEAYNSFLEHSLSLQINENIRISGNVDFLVATGSQIPRVPFFTLHEYKPEPNVSTDPMGQLLIAMVAAQKANEKAGMNYPLYGCYTIGRLWFFVVLNGKTYSRSLAFDATQNDLFDILNILKKVKNYIEETMETIKNH